MSRTLLLGIVVVQLACTPPFLAESEKEAAAAEAKEQARWTATESRLGLALCLDIAKFEKQWNNYASWSFDSATGVCKVQYKQAPADQMSPMACKERWLPGWVSGDPLPVGNISEQYELCVNKLFTREWSAH